MANFIEIRDFAAPELDVYARLTENQLLCRRDPENAMFIAESPMVIERALDAGCVPLSFLMKQSTPRVRQETFSHGVRRILTSTRQSLRC